ncbi:Hsp20/alpha crystallin family protein [Cyanobacterium stanieri LEGE 03274]|uniref:Hsp20/alpha crystallin family protein n=1 Tax=Cyanobacterium stanieri LEGE 03274 TaxID=1828756 RepID=A0ABR9V6R5_9CHRO|nr:Hsp20/alpha crystallin family protein [Cyanobacterium stanieri]MBE9222786.1 Hsp20/alpha crystallin family protein [Cyanobacterium stanieri LEGE 03274]
MSLVRFYPLSDVNGLHRQMNRLFDELSNTWEQVPTIGNIPLELFDNGDTLVLKAVLPGVNKDDIDISVSRQNLKIAGEYHQNVAEKENNYFISEFNYGKFERTINLPFPIKNTEVVADYNDGILTLTLPKVEEVKNKVVKVSLNPVKSIDN